MGLRDKEERFSLNRPIWYYIPRRRYPVFPEGEGNHDRHYRTHPDPRRHPGPVRASAIPKFARSLGEAKKEFTKALKEEEPDSTEKAVDKKETKP
jgi:hypothetical protein